MSARGARREMKENYWPTWSISIIVVRFECPRIGLVPENVFSPRFTFAKKFSPATRRDRVCQTLPNIIINYVIINYYVHTRGYVKISSFSRRPSLKIIVKSSYERGLFFKGYG